MKISVVIPALNERIALPVLISSLRAFESIQEIIVADGGSTDGTQEWCIRKPGMLLVHSDTGKGPQINAGAAQATGDLLLFLHADSCLSSSAFRAMEHLIASQDFAGGAFHVCFAGKRTAGLRMVEKGINLRTSIRHTATGDQGIFVKRTIFQAVGGAPNLPLFEDVELVSRIKKAGRFVVLKTPLTISARRYVKHGILRTAFLICLLRLGYALGISPEQLKKWFGDVRESRAPA